MANKERGEVDFCGHVLRFTTNAVCDLEGELGLPIGAIAARVGDAQNVDFSVVRAMIRAGLAGGGTKVSLTEAGDIFDGGEKLENLSRLMEAFALCFPKPEGGGKDKNPPKAAAGTGGKSAETGIKPGAATKNSGS